MSYQTTDCYAIATDIEVAQTELISKTKNPPVRSQLVALWRVDEHSKLYCQWIKQPLNTINQ